MLYVDVWTFQYKISLINIDKHLTNNIETVRKNFESWKKR